MRHYDQLTLAGQSRRLRRLAGEALKAYGLRNPQFKLIQNWEDATYKVDVPGESKRYKQADPFVPGRYLLRIHRPNRRTVSQVASELAWLTMNELAELALAPADKAFLRWLAGMGDS